MECALLPTIWAMPIPIDSLLPHCPLPRQPPKCHCGLSTTRMRMWWDSPPQAQWTLRPPSPQPLGGTWPGQQGRKTTLAGADRHSAHLFGGEEPAEVAVLGGGQAAATLSLGRPTKYVGCVINPRGPSFALPHTHKTLPNNNKNLQQLCLGCFCMNSDCLMAQNTGPEFRPSVRGAVSQRKVTKVI